MWQAPPRTRKLKAATTFPHFCVVAGRMLIGLFALFVWAASEAFALDPNTSITQYMHEVWTMDNGLPQNAVLSLKQTRDGYLWVGTSEGLVRFNGVDFSVFNPSNTPELPQASSASFFEDRDGALWFG